MGERRPEGDDRWFAPAVPTVANLVLGVFWGFSGYGGWGRSAFCHAGHGVNERCAAGFARATTVSSVPAALALLVVAVSWSVPAVRRDPELLDALLAVAALTWAAAELILLATGFLLQP